MSRKTHRLLVMGVAGCGKSTLADQVARAMYYPLIEGDEHHPAANQDKMRQGIALDDADRAPWLRYLGFLLAQASGGAVLTCSALKRRYREQLRLAVPSLAIAFIDIPLAQALVRVKSRQDHLFPASLVQSQFDALESPVDEPGVLRIDAMQPVAVQRDTILHWLGHSTDPLHQRIEEKLT